MNPRVVRRRFTGPFGPNVNPAVARQGDAGFDAGEAVRELASIRSGTGYDDLKHDLRRLAVLYRDRKAELSGRKYDGADEAKALALADEINLRQRGPSASDQSKLERRVWKLLRAAGERAYDAAYFVTDVLPLVQKSIPSIHAWRTRARTNPVDASTDAGGESDLAPA